MTNEAGISATARIRCGIKSFGGEARLHGSISWFCFTETVLWHFDILRHLKNMERESKESRSSSSQDSPIKSGDILEQLKQIYFNKIKPLEDEFCFDHFYWPSLTDSDFDSNAMVTCERILYVWYVQVLLLGQYSTGKTSFIRFLLEEDYPGMRISPEPTTDCFIAIMRGEEKTQVHGHSLTVQCDKPFQGLSKFGDNFLNKFQGSYVTSPNTENIIFIDTPGTNLPSEKFILQEFCLEPSKNWEEVTIFVQSSNGSQAKVTWYCCYLIPSKYEYPAVEV